MINNRMPQSESTVNDNTPPSSAGGYFGLSTTLENALIWVIEAPFEATVSYREGTADGPLSILSASHQLDFFDMDVGDVRNVGFAVSQGSRELAHLNQQARPLAKEVIQSLEAGTSVNNQQLQTVNHLCEKMVTSVHSQTHNALQQEKIPLVIGGDHSCALGAIQACINQFPGCGILQIDAHADLRLAYEGFTYSHASIFRHVVDQFPETPLVQIGIRDYCQEEWEQIQSRPNVHTVFDRTFRKARIAGRFDDALEAVVDRLPEQVYVSLDVDGLQPHFCPSTGTPVPGGFSFDEVIELMERVVRSGRRFVGVDVCEVSGKRNSDGSDALDSMIGARLIYKLGGFAAISQGKHRWPEHMP